MKLARHVTLLLGALTDSDVADMLASERQSLRRELERIGRKLDRASAVPAAVVPRSGVLDDLQGGRQS